MCATPHTVYTQTNLPLANGVLGPAVQGFHVQIITINEKCSQNNNEIGSRVKTGQCSKGREY